MENKPVPKLALKSTYSDLDWSSTDDDYNDIIKGPSPPPRKVSLLSPHVLYLFFVIFGLNNRLRHFLNRQINR